MFSSLRKAKKITSRGLFISTLSHVKLIAETRVYIGHKNMKSMGIFFIVFQKFSRKKKYKKYSTGNEEWIESETATLQVIMYYIITWAFHKLTCR